MDLSRLIGPTVTPWQTQRIILLLSFSWREISRNLLIPDVVTSWDGLHAWKSGETNKVLLNHLFPQACAENHYKDISKELLNVSKMLQVYKLDTIIHCKSCLALNKRVNNFVYNSFLINEVLPCDE